MNAFIKTNFIDPSAANFQCDLQKCDEKAKNIEEMVTAHGRGASREHPR